MAAKRRVVRRHGQTDVGGTLGAVGIVVAGLIGGYSLFAGPSSPSEGAKPAPTSTTITRESGDEAPHQPEPEARSSKPRTGAHAAQARVAPQGSTAQRGRGAGISAARPGEYGNVSTIQVTGTGGRPSSPGGRFTPFPPSGGGRQAGSGGFTPFPPSGAGQPSKGSERSAVSQGGGGSSAPSGGGGAAGTVSGGSSGSEAFGWQLETRLKTIQHSAPKGYETPAHEGGAPAGIEAPANVGGAPPGIDAPANIGGAPANAQDLTR